MRDEEPPQGGVDDRVVGFLGEKFLLYSGTLRPLLGRGVLRKIRGCCPFNPWLTGGIPRGWRMAAGSVRPATTEMERGVGGVSVGATGPSLDLGFLIDNMTIILLSILKIGGLGWRDSSYSKEFPKGFSLGF